MPAFPKPKFDYTVNLSKEIKALRLYRDSKPSIKTPKSTSTNLVVATWNIANFGLQERQEEHLKIIAEIISWFDIVALQETKENYQQLQTVVQFLGKKYQVIFSDAGGNNERMAFVYNSSKLKMLNEVGELNIPPSDLNDIQLPGINEPFNGFDRNPFMVSFKVKSFEFVLLNVHLYFGDDSEQSSINRRCLEAFSVGRWADLRTKSKFAYTKNVFALGDFNLPKIDKDDPIYKALIKRGLQLPDHTSLIYSNINDDKAYDQIAFLPGTASIINAHGIFPYDNAVFADLYKTKTAADFKSYLKYYISDHRPMWLELNIEGE